MTKTILKILQNEEMEAMEESDSSGEKWHWMENMIQVLLCNEIYKRRHGGKRGFFAF